MREGGDTLFDLCLSVGGAVLRSSCLCSMNHASLYLCCTPVEEATNEYIDGSPSYPSLVS